MAAGNGHVPDWRDAAAYQPLLDADRSLFAWEWLRRSANYRDAAERALQTASRSEPGNPSGIWGLHAFESPDVTVPQARPVWSARLYPHVLAAEAVPSKSSDNAFDLGRLGALATLVPAGRGGGHLLISDGLRSIRLDVLAGTITEGPVQLRFRFDGLASAERLMPPLRRFLSLCRTNKLNGSIHPREARAGRWVQMLRAHDALAAGASQREIAAALLSGEAGQRQWRVLAPSIRSQAQRLARRARQMASGGYLGLLQ